MAEVDVDGDRVEAAGEADLDADAPAVAVGGADRKGKRAAAKQMGYVLYELPWFVYLLLIYVIVKLAVTDVRDTFLEIAAYRLTWVECLYALGAFIGLAEIYKISEPGVRNTREALLIVITAVAYLCLFILGAAQVPYFIRLFNNSEFLVITAIALAAAITAFIINPRTAQRSIYSGQE